MATTNYYNTFIEVAGDCPVEVAELPTTQVGQMTIASLEYELISKNPYKYTSDEILFMVHAKRRNIKQTLWTAEWENFFSTSKACLRSSPLAKRYGWGFHFDEVGKVAIYAVESDVYERYKNNSRLTHLKAMRSVR